MIQSEGVGSLSVAELQAASQARGMRALGMPQQRLVSQLHQVRGFRGKGLISYYYYCTSSAIGLVFQPIAHFHVIINSLDDYCMVVTILVHTCHTIHIKPSTQS